MRGACQKRGCVRRESGMSTRVSGAPSRHPNPKPKPNPNPKPNPKPKPNPSPHPDQVYKSPSSKGRGVVGVLEVDFVEPSHDKQDLLTLTP